MWLSLIHPGYTRYGQAALVAVSGQCCFTAHELILAGHITEVVAIGFVGASDNFRLSAGSTGNCDVEICGTAHVVAKERGRSGGEERFDMLGFVALGAVDDRHDTLH